MSWSPTCPMAGALAAFSLVAGACSASPEAGSASLELSWPDSLPMGSEVLLHARVEAWPSGDESASTVLVPDAITTGAVGQTLELSIEGVPNGADRVVVAEVRDPSGNTVLLYGFSAPFAMEPGSAVGATVAVPLSPVKAQWAGVRPFELEVDGEVVVDIDRPELAAVRARLTFEQAVAARVSPSPTFSYAVTELSVQGAQACVLQEGIHVCVLDIDFGAEEASLEGFGAGHAVYAQLVDEEGYESDVRTAVFLLRAGSFSFDLEDEDVSPVEVERIDAGDLDGHGGVELIGMRTTGPLSVGGQAGVSILQAPGPFLEEASFTPIDDLKDARIADGDGDGDLDVLVLRGAKLNNLELARYEVTETLELVEEASATLGTDSLIGGLGEALFAEIPAVDLDGDGVPEWSLRWTLTNDIAFFSPPEDGAEPVLDITGLAWPLALRPGHVDVLAVGVTGPSGGEPDAELLQHVGGLDYETVCEGLELPPIVQMLTGDLDGDGALDVVARPGLFSVLDPSKGDPEAGLYVLYNDGHGLLGLRGEPCLDMEGHELHLEPSLGGSSSIHKLIVSDVDSDGDADLVASHGDGGVAIWSNDGIGTFTDTEQSLPLSDVASLVEADLDGDGDPDLVGRGLGGVRVWWNGTFADGF